MGVFYRIVVFYTATILWLWLASSIDDSILSYMTTIIVTLYIAGDGNEE